MAAGVGPFQVGSEGFELQHGKPFCSGCLKDGHCNKVNFAGLLEPMENQPLNQSPDLGGISAGRGELSSTVSPAYAHYQESQ